MGSGIMGERLAGGNVAIALLGNTLSTGFMLIALILSFAPISGAHFNPAVSLVSAALRELSVSRLASYVVAQLIGAVAGVVLAHAMFAEPLLQTSTPCPSRAGPNGYRKSWRPSGSSAPSLGSRARDLPPWHTPLGSTSPVRTGSPRRLRSQIPRSRSRGP